MSRSEEVVQHAADSFEGVVDRLSEYLRYPAISCSPEHAQDVRALAERVRDDLEAMGLERARLLDLPDAHPVVAAEWRAGPERPTVLVYGHLDLQPVVPEEWATPPHQATRKGDRLYARGAADDMGGWVSHVAAIQSWLACAGALPLNLKLIIEGEEEIGSPHLERYMDAHPEAFEADVMILTDCDNPSTEIPGLTISLRGVVEIGLTVEALAADVHSGMWGNMIPDAALALMQLVSRLLDADGRLRVGRVVNDPAWRKTAWDVPLDPEIIREGAHLLPGVEPLPSRDFSPAEWLWRQPAMTVVAATLPAPSAKKNAILRRASAILSVRVAPDQDPQGLLAAIREILLADPPGGVKVSVAPVGPVGEGWLCEPRGPAFAAADRAYRKAWGCPPARVGVGGSIPFVALFARRFGDVPLLLNGVIDPRTTAHGPNESLHLGVFRKTIAANVYLYEELGALSPGALRGGSP
jgi:acetylornithine deacetylase/succinyl-diaminopimelate desuccinylase-like protein